MNHPSTEGSRLNVPAHVKHARLIAWVAEIAALTEAANVYWCDGSQEEYDRLCEEMVASGRFIRLNPELRPNSFLARSHASDVAQNEGLIEHEHKEWEDTWAESPCISSWV